MDKFNNGKWLAVGILIGSLVGMGALFLYEIAQERNTPNDVVCQKGMAFEQASYGSGVYLKTEIECLDVDFIGEE